MKNQIRGKHRAYPGSISRGYMNSHKLCADLPPIWRIAKFVTRRTDAQRVRCRYICIVGGGGGVGSVAPDDAKQPISRNVHVRGAPATYY